MWSLSCAVSDAEAKVGAAGCGCSKALHHLLGWGVGFCCMRACVGCTMGVHVWCSECTRGLWHGCVGCSMDMLGTRSGQVQQENVECSMECWVQHGSGQCSMGKRHGAASLGAPNNSAKSQRQSLVVQAVQTPRSSGSTHMVKNILSPP